MEYTHKFSAGSVMMDKMLDEYHTLRKVRGYCKRCPNYGKYWSCPEFAFDETILLKEFKYMYLIGREFTIPKKDRQKVIGIKSCADYCTEVNNVMKVESWKDLLQLEEKVPGILTLMPGNCHICDLSGEGCARPKGQKCRHPDMMRFSLEALGFDVDSICKFEIGLLLQWPREGHLPEKLSTVMAVLTNQKIPMDLLHAHFPDAKRSYLKAGETILGGDEKPKAKRLDSWLDHQAQEQQAIEEAASGKKNSWIGFKSDAMDSGDYVKNRPWAQGDDEYPDAEETAQVLATIKPEEKSKITSADSVDEGPLAEEPEFKTLPCEEDEDSKYQWLGFKRSAEEAEEKMYARPIPKFSVSEEEKAAAEAAEAAEADAAAGTPTGEVQAVETALEQAEQEMGISDTLPPTSTTPVNVDRATMMRMELEKALRAQMAGMSEAEAEAFLAGKLGISVDPPQAAPQPVASQPVAPQPVAEPQPAAQPAPQAAPVAPVQPVPQPEPEPEPIEFLDASSVKDVLGAALSIAKAVVSEEPPKRQEPKPQQEASAPEPVQATPVAQPEPVPTPAPQPVAAPPEEEDDSKYKWLGFKGELKDDDDTQKGGWKKNY